MRTYDPVLGVYVESLPVSLAETRSDGWSNVVTGLGTSRDKGASHAFGIDCYELDFDTCATMLMTDDIAARIVEARPKEMFRKGYEIKVEDETDQDLASEFAKEAKRLDLDAHVLDAMIWGRGLGGALILVNADDGRDPSEPLDEKRITKIDSLSVFDARWARPMTYYADPLEPNFGKPETFALVNILGGAPVAVVHESRTVRFGGSLTDARVRRRRMGWDLSVLQRPYRKMRDFDSAFQNAGHVLNDMSQGVWKVAGLFQMIASGQSDVLATRMTALDTSRSNTRSIMIDKDGEDFEYVARALAGLPDMLDRFMSLLASAAEMPVTILMGRSPAGMNATGESDFQGWYDTIASEQIKELEPKLQRIYRFLSLAKDGPTGGKERDLEFHFRPLEEMSDKEQAELENVTATKDVAYINAGVLTPEEVALARYGTGEWSATTTIDVEAREAAQKDGASFDPYPADPEEVPPGAVDPSAPPGEPVTGRTGAKPPPAKGA